MGQRWEGPRFEDRVYRGRDKDRRCSKAEGGSARRDREILLKATASSIARDQRSSMHEFDFAMFSLCYTTGWGQQLALRE